MDARPVAWTPWKVVAAMAWAAVAFGLSYLLTILGILDGATFFGDDPPADQTARAWLWLAGAALAAAAAPLGAWLVDRRSGWLAVSALLLVGGVAASGWYLGT